MNINKMLKQGYLFPMHGRTEGLTPDVYRKCQDIQSLNEDLRDAKQVLNGDRNMVGLRGMFNKSVDGNDRDIDKMFAKHVSAQIDEYENKIINIKTEIKQKKKELELHKEFNIRIDQSVYPPQTYDLTKDEMPCRKSHGRFSNGDYYFYDFYDEEVSDD